MCMCVTIFRDGALKEIIQVKVIRDPHCVSILTRRETDVTDVRHKIFL